MAWHGLWVEFTHSIPCLHPHCRARSSDLIPSHHLPLLPSLSLTWTGHKCVCVCGDFLCGLCHPAVLKQLTPSPLCGTAGFTPLPTPCTFGLVLCDACACCLAVLLLRREDTGRAAVARKKTVGSGRGNGLAAFGFLPEQENFGGTVLYGWHAFSLSSPLSTSSLPATCTL